MKAADRLHARHARDHFRGLRHAFERAASIHAAGDMGVLDMALWRVYQPEIARQANMAVALWRRFGPVP